MIALVEGMGIDDLPYVPRLASGLAGGMCGTHKWTCGAINSAAVVAGIFRGRDTVQPGEGHPRIYKMMTEFMDDVEGEFGSVLCPELTGISPDHKDEEFSKLFWEKDCMNRVCHPVKEYVIKRLYRLMDKYPPE
jgi:C_GCAxxG_C_C family probable redox protein